MDGEHLRSFMNDLHCCAADGEGWSNRCRGVLLLQRVEGNLSTKNGSVRVRCQSVRAQVVVEEQYFLCLTNE